LLVLVKKDVQRGYVSSTMLVLTLPSPSLRDGDLTTRRKQYLGGKNATQVGKSSGKRLTSSELRGGQTN
jgi:hypothetical protein